jgi:hypothetical protein
MLNEDDTGPPLTCCVCGQVIAGEPFHAYPDPELTPWVVGSTFIPGCTCSPTCDVQIRAEIAQVVAENEARDVQLAPQHAAAQQAEAAWSAERKAQDVARADAYAAAQIRRAAEIDANRRAFFAKYP